MTQPEQTDDQYRQPAGRSRALQPLDGVQAHRAAVARRRWGIGLGLGWVGFILVSVFVLGLSTPLWPLWLVAGLIGPLLGSGVIGRPLPRSYRQPAIEPGPAGPQDGFRADRD